MLKKKLMVLMLAGLTVLSGCSRLYYYSSSIDDDDLVEVSYDAIGWLLADLRQPLPKGSLVVINSLVNVDDMGQTLPFGRIISDQLSSALHRSGYRVMGMELPTEIFAKNEAGILELPEKTKEALNNVGAKAIVIGSYAPGRDNVYVSLRVVDIASQNVVSSTDYSVAMGPDAKVLTTKPQPKQ
ncbi:FlgO family outer membrane protein [Methylomonas sp. EFPC3]|uniref:FlgO family outer membrane protein n=1 Tax=Methylomonas sp. EFPC3 TaxID=3021710 RepID=UPI002417C66F|nr:FlgO family outer membrane protein [Methylomonas sp. EFPC3]WFP49361.1 FlgO family outer membrane protein [Methylomonas sp. EFPC3]